MSTKAPRPGKNSVIRTFSLPNGEKIVGVREATLRAGVRAANTALKVERSKTVERSKPGKPSGPTK